MKAARFDFVAQPYRFLEHIMFGRTLQQARVAWISKLPESANVLILGEGDGRFVEALLARWPSARVTVVEASERMMSLARSRVGERVTFIHGDARTIELGENQFDCLVTHFFLDCFSQLDVEDVLRKISRAAKPQAVWLLADFELPAQGWRRCHAQLWLSAMYLFFRLTTGLESRELPRVSDAMREAGFKESGVREWRWGLLRSTAWLRQGSAGATPSTPPSHPPGTPPGQARTFTGRIEP